MSTPIKITPETPPVFPCWLWHPEHNWRKITFHACPAESGWTHWRRITGEESPPDQPAAGPGEEPRKQPVGIAHIESVTGVALEHPVAKIYDYSATPPASETPETDAEFARLDELGNTLEPFAAMADFARTLERSLAATRKRGEELEEQLAERLPDTLDWHTVMSDVHDYFADEKADRSRGRGTLLLTLLGNLRCQRDEAREERQGMIARHQKWVDSLNDTIGKRGLVIDELQAELAALRAQRDRLQAEVNRLHKGLWSDKVEMIDELAALRAQLAAMTKEASTS
jgi:hypothetical protein